MKCRMFSSVSSVFRVFQILIISGQHQDEDALVKILSDEKYACLQEVFYVKELGVSYICRMDFENVIANYHNLLNYDFFILQISII